MPTSVAIRLAVEGGVEVKRTLEDAGRAGQAAFQSVSTAADQAGVATDRQTARFQRLAQAAREAESQQRAQANVNSLLGVGAGSAGSARDSASVFEAELARQDQIRAARQEQAARTSQSNINTLLGIRDAQVGAARSSAVAFEEAYRAEAEALKRTADLRATALRNASSGWRDLGAQGAATLANIEASRRLGSLGGMPQAANQNERLRSDQVQNLMYQGGDVLSQLGSGSPLGMIAFQQGPQIAQVFAGPGGASVKGAFSQAGEAVSGFVSRIGMMGGVVGGVTAIVLTGVGALSSYRSQQKELELATAGVGRASGATVGQINAVALASSTAAGVSVSTARDMAGQFASTGRIGSAMYASLIGISRDYAVTTRQDLPDATKALAEAFADPVRGAEQLNAQLGLLDAGTQETIQRLSQQGDRLGAQRILFDALSGSIDRAESHLGFFSRGWERFKVASSNEIDAIGRFVDRGFGGGAAEERLATLQGQLDFRQRNMGTAGGIFDRVLGFDVDAIKKQIAEVQTEIDKASRQGRTADLAQRGLQVESIVRSLNPGAEALKQMEDRAENIRKFLADGGIDKDGASRRTMEGLLTQARQLKEDMAAGGSGFADAVRAADFARRTSGFAPTALSAAQINEQARNKDLAALREAGNDAASQQYLARAQSIELERTTLLRTLDTEASRSATVAGGAFSRAPITIQQMSLDASKATGISETLIAALGEKENAFRLTGATKVLNAAGQPSTSAYGFGQITRGAERDIQTVIPGFDRTNPDTAVLGTATYLKILKDRFGGDEDRALQAYYGSRNPEENRLYAADVRRRQGATGDASDAGVTRDIDANARALAAQGEQVRNVTENYGRNALAMEANSRAAQQLAELQGRGVVVTDELRASILRFASEGASAALRLKLVQFANDNAFDREQIGRDRIDQSAYARARSLVGDTSSPAARSVIEASRLNDNLRLTKDLATDAFGGMLTDLRQGVGFMSALSNAAGRFADRLLSLAADKAISSLFGNLFGGGGANPLASLFGGSDSPTGGVRLFDGGGYTGPGGRSDPAGIVHRGEVVYSQDDVARHGGVAAVEAMRRSGGLRGYDRGGPVGRDAFTMPSRAAMQPANDSSPAINAPISITMQGSSGDPARDREHIEQTAAALHEQMRAVFRQEQANSMRQGGSLWQAGLRRARG